MALDKGEMVAAQKALLLLPGLSGAARQVGGTILAHYNAMSGRCDPGTKRLARECGVSIRTVKDAIETLNARNLIPYVTHGGGKQANAYLPNFGLLRSISEECEKRILGDGEAPEKSARQYRAESAKRRSTRKRNGAKNRTGQSASNCTASGAENRTRTLRSNSTEENSIAPHPSKPDQAVPSQGLRNDGDRHHLQRLLAKAQSRAPKPKDVAEKRAADRISDHFREQGKAISELFWSVAMDGGEAYTLAVAAETRTPGTGIRQLERIVTEAARLRELERAAA